MTHCCSRMRYELKKGGTTPSERRASPDALVDYSARYDEYGILVHDRGRSYVQNLGLRGTNTGRTSLRWPARQ